jgi:hypothetical protein
VVDEDIRARGAGTAAEMVEDVGQLAEPELGRSTTAARVLRETDGGPGFGGHGPITLDRSRSTSRTRSAILAALSDRFELEEGWDRVERSST